MLKIATSLLLLACFQGQSSAQGSVHGKITDSLQTPLPFVTIALLKTADSTIVKGTLSDETGFYSLNNIGPGTYLLKVTALGYSDGFSPVFSADSTSAVELLPLRLTQTGTRLKEVSVSVIKQTIEFKNGNIIVNVANSPLAKGNSVFDLLSKLPGVSTVDNIITLQGRNGVVILIDGRPQQLSSEQIVAMLKSMTAESVEKIEILKNPPSKYDASGTAGMIDLKTKKTQLLGFSGSIYSNIAKGLYGAFQPGITLNYKTEKITLSAGFEYGNFGVQAIENFNRTFTSGAGQTVFTGKNIRVQTGESYGYKGGADWNVNKKNTLGIKLNGEHGGMRVDGTGLNTVSGVNNMGFDHLQSVLKLPDNWDLNNYNFTAEHRFDTSATTLNFTTDYTTLSETASSYNQNLFLGPVGESLLPENTYQSSNASLTGILASRLDFSKHLDSVSSLEAGLKMSRVDVRNNFLFQRKNDTSGNFYTDTSQTNNFTYTETTSAAYVNYLRSWKKLNVQLGLRGENTILQGRNTGKSFRLDQHYLNLFPNFSLEYAKTENHNFQLNINRRIDRPEYDNLNPFRYYRDQYSYFQGNPFLLPHYSNNIELTYSYKKTFMNSFSYNRIEHVMLPYTQQNDLTKVQVESIKNMDYSEALTYSGFYQAQVKSWWLVSANAVVSYLTYKGDIQGTPFRTASVYYNGYLNNTLTLPKKMKLEINSFYTGPKYNGVVLMQQRWMVSLAVKRSFLHDKLDLTLGLNDVFATSGYQTASNFSNQQWNYAVTSDMRRVYVVFHYNFGKLKMQEPEKGKEDPEKERLKH